MLPHRPHGADPFLSFEIVFKGEDVVGEGGPWRQFFTDIARELQDPIFNCPLLIPSPNAVVCVVYFSMGTDYHGTHCDSSLNPESTAMVSF